MSRLIDAEELINERPESLNPNMSDEIKSAYNKGWNACNSEWFSLIDEQPTAYDIDRVIEQLEELKETAYECYGCASGAYVAMCNAIEIVKKGGIE